MTTNGWIQIFVFLAVILAITKPLGVFMARVFSRERTFLDPVARPIERLLYRVTGVDEAREMRWTEYAFTMLLFSGASMLLLYLIERAQQLLPWWNPQKFAAVPLAVAFNTAASFTTNTNWQNYSGESTMIYLTQMAGLAYHNFASAAVGIALAIAFIRGIARKEKETIGNFWVDMTRSTLWVLLPACIVYALVLVSQGVVQNLKPYDTAKLIEPQQVQKTGTDGKPVVGPDGKAVMDTVTDQTIAQGPVASQEAIKMLGTNGGGFFNANSAHPFENPTPLSNFLQMISMLLIPAALCFTFGRMVGDSRQGWAVFAGMTVIFVVMASIAMWAEQQGNPLFTPLGVDQTQSALQAGGNMEGKETRIGVVASALFATVTTAASCGATNAMHDSFTPLGGMVPMWLIELGEVVFGGVGSGLYGMLVFAIMAVFVAGLMIGRTPEYVGKKIESFEVKMTSIVILVTPFLVLVGAAIAVMTEAGRAGVFNPAAHGFAEVLYALSSAANNNGSAFAGLSANTPFYNTLLAVAMWFGRFAFIVPVLGIAGSLAKKKRIEPTAGTLPTHGPLFVAMLVGTVVLVGALTYVPALALGPVVEHLQLYAIHERHAIHW